MDGLGQTRLPTVVLFPLVMTLNEIRFWLNTYRKFRALGESVPSISEIAKRAGLSRQTLYALIRDQRSEFGEVAQIRLSRVIQQMNRH